MSDFAFTPQPAPVTGGEMVEADGEMGAIHRETMVQRRGVARRARQRLEQSLDSLEAGSGKSALSPSAPEAPSEQPAPYTCKHGCERDILMDRIHALSHPSEQGKLADLLTKAVGDIAAALTVAGQQGKIAAWTRPYADALNEHDARARQPGAAS